jgi:N6-adenosine-specific RNA methylase IME4
MKFQVIVADAPWSFDDKLAKMKAPTKRSAASQYDVMTVGDIAKLDVASLADPAGCVLALWVPGSFMSAGIEVAEAWGFKVKQNYVWIKTKKRKLKAPELVHPENHLAFGMGRLFRQTHETALICTSGKSVYPGLDDHSQRSVCFFPNLGHSRKPPNLHTSLEKMFPDANRCEFFARQDILGWTCVGRECPSTLGEDIHDSIKRLVIL